MFVQTLLGHFLLGIAVGRAEFEHEVTQMIGLDLNGRRDDVTLVVGAHDDSLAVLPSYFVGAWVWIGEGIPADSASSTIFIVLDLENA